MERFNEMMQGLELERSKEINKLMELASKEFEERKRKEIEKSKEFRHPVKCKRAILF